MEKKELISIIVPVYNVAKYLNACIVSIINQTYENLEIILVDDGSTDSSGIICDEWAKKDSRIKVFHKKNGGVSSARNVGLDVAKGQYIGFVDGDDYIEKEMYVFLYNLVIENNADISSCGYYKVYGTKKKEGVGTHFEKVMDRDEAVHQCVLANSIFPSVWLKLYKKEIVQNIRFDEKYKISEDYLFNYYAAAKCTKFACNAVPMYNYIMQENSALHKLSSLHCDDSLDVALEIENDVEIRIPNLKDAANRLCIVRLLGLINEANKKNDKAKMQKLIQKLDKYKFTYKSNTELKSFFKIMLCINFFNHNLFLFALKSSYAFFKK